MLQKKSSIDIASGASAETERQKLLRQYNVTGINAENSFDHITSMAATVLKVPVTLVTFIGEDKIWLNTPVSITVEQLACEAGLCAAAVLQDDIYVVENALTDPRTCANTLVTGSFALRFFAAGPLKTRDGYKLGTISIIDKIPRSITDAEKSILKNLAEILVDQLELRREAGNASATQNQILSMIAHELKNPLTIIPVYAELIKEEAKDKEHIAQMCNHIRKASDRMTLLIKDVLETARLQVNEITFNKTHFDIATVIGRVAALNLVLANAKNQKLYLGISDNLIVHADETKISEVADNLINNAIKYSPKGAEIHLNLTVGYNKAIFEVIDEGPGLTSEDIQDLFKPYTRLSAKPTGGENSTGVGLSIVKMLVEAHGGNVRAENNTNKKGAKFIVEIPVVSEQVLTPYFSAEQIN